VNSLNDPLELMNVPAPGYSSERGRVRRLLNMAAGSILPLFEDGVQRTYIHVLVHVQTVKRLNREVEFC
jgi:hypothetical protein